MAFRFPRLHGTRFAVACSLCAATGLATAQPVSPELQRFRDIYKELIEINTTHSSGSTTKAAQAMQARLQSAGFGAGEMQIIEPFPAKGNLVLRWNGDGRKKPILLLAHIDVVEAKREDWKTDPFTLQEGGGYFTARGAIDDKAMAAGLVSVLDQLKREGFKPQRDIILALTADEERGNVDSNGVRWMLNNKPGLLQAELGINEGGGGELRNGKPNVHRVQVAEKLFTSFTLELRDVGGHSSLPTASNPIYAMSAALTRLGAHHFPVKLADVTKTYFSRSAQFASGQLAADMRAIGSGQTSPALLARLSRNPAYNAQLRTTCTATMLNAGHAENALPQSAKATVNCRILPFDNPDDIERQIRQVLANDNITVQQVSKPTISPVSPLKGAIADTIEQLTKEMWPGVPVIPFMSTGATDSRFARNAGIPMYGVSGLFFEPADLRIHGLDERVEIKYLYESREFLYRLVKKLAS
ncbi:M20/M25/M40 family metallo-hydrolase [Herbaspirillum autotrophicum]|uniref:M20/M25/M40 family metallo-hydrolase n=1 Tax=Herbaspirillum autotrophicum TaxID=180195 RepID=UPI00067AB2AD|nr:M20/M25/M40 family metallo-hydrolase [Herbaspirillum autotrophicum]